MPTEHFDAVVIGAGPAGEAAVSRLKDHGLKIALTERELVGGECAYWACIPSKTLLRPVEARAEARRAAGLDEPARDWRAAAEYRDYMIRELDDSKEVDGYRRDGVTVIKGDARIAGRGRVEVEGRALAADHLLIATGSETNIPPIDGLEEAGYWTNREATTVKDLPKSVLIVGGGPVGVELSQFFCRFGVETTLVQSAERLVDREDPAVSDLAVATLREDGVDVRLGARAQRVRLRDGRRVVTLEGGDELSAQEVVIAPGRKPRVEGLGLEEVGIEPSSEGIPIDDQCRAADGVWAIGDVTGIMPFTHVGKYQARIATNAIAGRSGRADYRAIPRVVFSDPEIAAVGLTERQAREKGIDVATSRIALPEAIARPHTYETEPRGDLGLVADRRRQVLVGAWAVAPLAGEWIHQAALAIKTATPLEVLRDTVAQFPTFTEGYLAALERLDA
ncbi:MAG: NAD(P)/FAD-dependent oxidoreductase [Actinomycetota bacterium]|nr:NAD(P)/FAD-dependent oxidoreductase [Actinomycetota bacterium]